MTGLEPASEAGPRAWCWSPGSPLLRRRRGVGRTGSGGPARQELDRVVLRRAWLGGEDGEGVVAGRVDGEVLEGQEDLPDRRVSEGLDARLVRPDVVGGQPRAKGAAAGGELTDQRDQGRVVGTAAGLDPEQGHRVAGDALPLREQLPRQGGQ